MTRSLYQRVRGRDTLHRAWRKVRENGLKSLSIETRESVKAFDGDSYRRLRRIEDQLRRKRFKFAPQKGVLKKRAGKSPRPLVVAALENRIVQRAILDVLQDELAIQDVLATPTSFGGIKGRGVQEAIAFVCKAMDQGATHYIRSDIEGFFTKIPRETVTGFLSKHFADDDFLDLFNQATETKLANLKQLGDDAFLFPLKEEGVAQGSPLSPLIGNILLKDFDTDMNGRGITCLRYIDDFILLGPNSASVKKAFKNAQVKLSAFNMMAYDPNSRSDKAQMGKVGCGFDFLGCYIVPGFVHPSRSARAKIIAAVADALDDGRKALIKAAKSSGINVPKRRYAQTLVDIDRILLGWRHSFAFCTGPQVFEELDRKIDEQLAEFRRLAKGLAGGKSLDVQRRIMGVQLLNDIKPMA